MLWRLCFRNTTILMVAIHDIPLECYETYMFNKVCTRFAVCYRLYCALTCLKRMWEVGAPDMLQCSGLLIADMMSVCLMVERCIDGFVLR